MIQGTVLVVDDEEAIRIALADALESHGYVVVQAASADEAVRLRKNHTIDVALIDLRMPGELDGMELMEVLRAQNPPTDVIILTAYGTLDTSLEAMRSGVFDYLLKPVETDKVIETIDRCIDRRRGQQQRHRMIGQIETLLDQLKSTDAGPDEEQSLQGATLLVDFQKRLVMREGKYISLTPTEFDLLAYLATHASRVVSARELVEGVHGQILDEEAARPIVRVNIRSLRQKIEVDPSNPAYIQTVRDHGYRFMPG
ncbi:MAG: response regulator transcription factor [Anaerolineaceae bacterium]